MATQAWPFGWSFCSSMQGEVSHPWIMQPAVPECCKPMVGHCMMKTFIWRCLIKKFFLYTSSSTDGLCNKKFRDKIFNFQWHSQVLWWWIKLLYDVLPTIKTYDSWHTWYIRWCKFNSITDLNHDTLLHVIPDAACYEYVHRVENNAAIQNFKD
jgi:hypothetical protein